MKKTAFLAAFLATCLVAGAAEAKKFKWDDARKIQAGMTTEEVTRLMGAPTSVRSADGVVRYVWVSMGLWSSKTQTLVIDFKDGKVVEAPPIPAEFK